MFDVAPDAPAFGKLVAMLPVGSGAKQAHHTSYALQPNGVLFANDWLGNRTYMFDVRDPQTPRLIAQFGNAGKYMYPHSFVYLTNGNTLATFQYTGGFNQAPGGLVEIDSHGHIVKTSSAADPHVDRNIRPYSLTVVEKLNRVVTGSADMMGAQKSRVVQVWRLSDLKLLKTIVLPQASDWFADDAADASEPRVLADGKTVAVPTFHCGLYLLRDLAGDPTLKHVYDFGYRVCEVPIVVGNYLVETMQSGHAIVSLDMHDPSHPARSRPHSSEAGRGSALARNRARGRQDRDHRPRCAEHARVVRYDRPRNGSTRTQRAIDRLYARVARRLGCKRHAARNGPMAGTGAQFRMEPYSATIEQRRIEVRPPGRL